MTYEVDWALKANYWLHCKNAKQLFRHRDYFAIWDLSPRFGNDENKTIATKCTIAHANTDLTLQIWTLQRQISAAASHQIVTASPPVMIVGSLQTYPRVCSPLLGRFRYEDEWESVDPSDTAEVIFDTFVVNISREWGLICSVAFWLEAGIKSGKEKSTRQNRNLPLHAISVFEFRM